MLTVGSESNKAAVIANLEDPIPALLSFQRRAGGQLPAARALEWVWYCWDEEEHCDCSAG